MKNTYPVRLNIVDSRMAMETGWVCPKPSSPWTCWCRNRNNNPPGELLAIEGHVAQGIWPQDPRRPRKKLPESVMRGGRTPATEAIRVSRSGR